MTARRPHARQRVAAAGCATAIAVIGVPSVTALTATAAGHASHAARTAHPPRPAAAHRLNPTAAAKAAGITRPGQAYMGWRDGHVAMTAKVKHGKLVLSPVKVPGLSPMASGSGTKPDTGTPSVSPNLSSTSVSGMDVSHWQGTVPWTSWYNSGKRFAYIKATEGTSYVSSTFSAQYTGSYKAGMIRGAYHFGLPSGASGATQADYFVAHGGGWSSDGKTLPGVLDIEWNPYGSTCYDKTPSELISWVSSFVKQYRYRTGRDAVIYTAYSYWHGCLGNTSAFSNTNPLWLANYSTSNPPLFGSWPWFTFQQYTDSPLDQDRFNGSYTRLKALAG
jgi:GH25 family lysozyme M1 (1,4-beta-N-acetylmuramidase)